MHLLSELHRAPSIRATRWLNTSQSLSLLELRGQVVLIDFWDYTCINCLHTLPYLQAWHERYGSQGLTIIGVHTPEFDFAKSDTLVEAAVQRLALPYPIAIDSDYETWTAYGNRYWPAKYLLDPDGRVRAFHFGEGAYQEMEREIQKLLSILHPQQHWPEPVGHLNPLDDPLAFCERPSPELYCGTERGRFGNSENLPDELQPDLVYLEGAWTHHRQYSQHTDDQPASLSLVYRAASVNLVASPGDNEEVLLSLFLDGQPLPKAYWGADVEADTAGNACVKLRTSRMVQLIQAESFETHLLNITLDTTGFEAYALTFVTCVSDEIALA